MIDASSLNNFVPSARISGSRIWLPLPSVSAGNSSIEFTMMASISSALKSGEVWSCVPPAAASPVGAGVLVISSGAIMPDSA